MVARKTLEKVEKTGMDDEQFLAALEAWQKESVPKANIVMGSAPAMEIDRISSGSVVLDAITDGGIPVGRITEIYGPNSSGKTTFALSSIAQVQKNGGRAIFIDLEYAFNPKWAKKLGVDLDKLVVSRVEGAEAALGLLKSAIETNLFDIVVFDSVGVLKADGVFEKGLEHKGMTEVPRMLSTMLPPIASAASNTNTTVIMINQTRTDFSGPIPVQTATGGKALGYYASLRLNVRKMGKGKQIMEGDQVVGVTLKLTVDKSKIGVPFRQAETVVNFRSGLDTRIEAFGVGLAQGLIVPETKMTYVFTPTGEVLSKKGKGQAVQTLKDNQEIYDSLLDAIYKSVGDDEFDLSELDEPVKKTEETPAETE